MSRRFDSLTAARELELEAAGMREDRKLEAAAEAMADVVRARQGCAD